MEILRLFCPIPSPVVLEEFVGEVGKIIIGLLDW
ncbi:MAG: hypothetical protein MASP_00508 [Candidatus Methanolliviera sp. GoM_asphalt]|nr:MAG: hypothetical protein MASP_00508 [Candidatus Methanolliviera sp. GoM_asphalt]